jgi:DNA-binding transcriptional LysR family regulator
VLTDIKLLRLFDLLYSTRSVSRAAERLGQSQPAVSIWLGKLRRELKDPLFVRTPRGMEPTPRADALIEIAREVLESLRRLSARDPVFTPASSNRRFRICMTDASRITLLPQLLAHVRAVAASVRLEALLIEPPVSQLLRSGEADLALGFFPKLEAGLYQQALYPQDWICLVNARHPRIGRSLTIRLYKEEPHVTIQLGTGHHLLQNALAKHRILPRVLLELPGFLGLSAIVSTTDLVVTLPRHTGETLARAGGLKVFPCPFPVQSFTVRQHWHARYHNDAGNRWLRGVCRNLFQQRGIRGGGERRRASPGTGGNSVGTRQG